MARSDADEAFEWVVIMIGIVSGVMTAFPEMFWLIYPQNVSPSLQAAKAVVVPLLLTTMIWLIGKFSAERYQPIAKVIAWLYVSILISSYCLTYFGGIGLIPRNATMVGLGMVFLNIVGPVVIFKLIVPRYRESYPESGFLRSKIKLLIALSVAGLLWGLMVIVIGS